MGSQFKENYKRLAGNSNRSADGAKDLTLVSDALTIVTVGALAAVSGSFVGANNIAVVADGSGNVQISDTLLEVNESGSILQLDGGNTRGFGRNNVMFGVNHLIGSYFYTSYAYPQGNNFIAGSGNTIRNDAGWLNAASFCQGIQNTAYGYTSFTQGLNNINSDAAVVIGRDNVNTQSDSLIVGIGNNSGASRAIIVGAGNTISFGVSSAALGNNNNVLGSQVFVQGGGNDITDDLGLGLPAIGNFCQGLDNAVDGFGNFAQGNACQAFGKATFAQGISAVANRFGQRTWGAGFGVGVSRGQKSRIVFSSGSISDVEETLVMLDLDQDRVYAIKGMVSAKNTNTNTEVAIFEIPLSMAFRDTGGSAVLVNSPIALSGINSGGGSTAWSARLVSSGNNVLLQVTGDASDLVYWVSDLEFLEARG